MAVSFRMAATAGVAAEAHRLDVAEPIDQLFAESGEGSGNNSRLHPALPHEAMERAYPGFTAMMDALPECRRWAIIAELTALSNAFEAGRQLRGEVHHD